jgi:hypothetical protein
MTVAGDMSSRMFGPCLGMLAVTCRTHPGVVVRMHSDRPTASASPRRVELSRTAHNGESAVVAYQRANAQPWSLHYYG